MIRPMHVLALESAGNVGGVAVYGPEVQVELLAPLGPGRGEVLPELVPEALRLARLDWGHIGLVAVDLGPGSFTGLRLGLSLAKALAQARGLPLVGVRQTEVLGLPWAEVWPGRVCVWIHDRREYVYMAWVERDRAGMETVLPFAEALARVRERSPVLLVGSGALRFAQELQAQAPEVILAPEHFCVPHPLVVARLGLAKYNREGSADILALEPHYVHKEGDHG